MDFPSGVEKLYKKLNSFSLNDPNNSVLKLTAKGKTCGLVHSKTASVLENYPDVFIVADKTVSINPKYQTCDEITEAVRKVILDIKSKNIFSELNGWRNEEYNVKERFSSPEVLFRVERAASSLLGIKCYGSHINGYIKKDGKYYLWIARRSKTKPTFPGMLDNFSAGGLTAGLSPIECARKELEEEAGVGHEISSKIKMVDAITYAYSKNEYVHQEAEFVFDVKLPVDFKPVNTDGEVGEFYLMDVEEAKKAVIRDEFKPNSAAVTLNFLMRKGLVTSDERNFNLSVPNYLEILENFHVLGY